jgi:hypothetical protein
MKHAGEAALDAVEELLVQIRRYPALKEKKQGIFYWKSNAFLHFHEHGEKLFADLRVGSDWERFPVNTQPEREALLAQVDHALKL